VEAGEEGEDTEAPGLSLAANFFSMVRFCFSSDVPSQAETVFNVGPVSLNFLAPRVVTDDGSQSGGEHDAPKHCLTPFTHRVGEALKILVPGMYSPKESNIPRRKRPVLCFARLLKPRRGVR
jgi:hypothetical protein